MSILFGIIWSVLLAGGLVILLVYVNAQDERILNERRVEHERADERGRQNAQER